MLWKGKRPFFGIPATLSNAQDPLFPFRHPRPDRGSNQGNESSVVVVGSCPRALPPPFQSVQ